MRLANVLVVLGICADSAFSSEGDELSEVQAQAIEALQAAEKNGTFGKRGECNLFNARARPSKLRGDFAPGARNRYDDFVAAHINQTLSIHATGNFLTWHRHYVWAYENALREECGYDGYQPYWNWLTYRDDPSKAPMFDGSDTSLSGDGTFRAHNGSVAARGGVWIPSGNGGGCVTSGPFANMTVHLGPVRPGIDGLPVNPGGSFAYNPRCLSRDISAWTSKKWMNPSDVLNLTIGAAAKNVLSFQDELQGRF
ncbi:Tyrosinase-like protein orsC, partial [Colletotrichum shisoi]